MFDKRGRRWYNNRSGGPAAHHPPGRSPKPYGGGFFLFSFRVEYESERDVHEGARRLERMGVTGEVGIRPTPGGTWLMEVIAERAVRQQALKQLGGRPVGEAAVAGGEEEEEGPVAAAD